MLKRGSDLTCVLTDEFSLTPKFAKHLLMLELNTVTSTIRKISCLHQKTEYIKISATFLDADKLFGYSSDCDGRLKRT